MGDKGDDGDVGPMVSFCKWYILRLIVDLALNQPLNYLT